MELIQCFYWANSKRCTTLVPSTQRYCNDHQVGIYRSENAFETILGTKPIEEYRIIDYLPTMEDEIIYKRGETIIINETSDPPPLIDTLWANNLGVFKQYRGKDMLKNIHFRFQLHGTRDSVDLFHAILKKVDHDYPIAPFGKRTDKIQRCVKCNGYFWKDASIEPEAIKRAAKQSGITCKFKLWVSDEKCKGQLMDVQLGSV